MGHNYRALIFRAERKADIIARRERQLEVIVRKLGTNAIVLSAFVVMAVVATASQGMAASLGDPSPNARAIGGRHDSAMQSPARAAARECGPGEHAAGYVRHYGVQCSMNQ